MKTVTHRVNDERSSAADDSGDAALDISSKPAADTGTSGRIVSSYADNPRMMTIIPDFIAALPEVVQKMLDRLERRDLVSLKQIVHQLKGTCGGYGFDVVTLPAYQAEESIKTNKSIEQITADVVHLVSILRRIDGYNERKAPVSAAQRAKGC